MGGVTAAECRNKKPKRKDSINGETGAPFMTDLGYMEHFWKYFAVLFFHFASC